jgi:hypothetical protein
VILSAAAPLQGPSWWQQAAATSTRARANGLVKHTGDGIVVAFKAKAARESSVGEREWLELEEEGEDCRTRVKGALLP